MKLNQTLITLFVLLLCSSQLLSQEKTPSGDYWKITDRKSILWDLTSEVRLPHKDNIEMSGKNVASIIYYEIDEERNLKIDKDIIFPQLRTFNKSNEPNWKKYRAYFRKEISDKLSPSISYNDVTIVPSKVDSIEIGGMITFYYTPIQGLKITKTIYPSMDDRLLVEEWNVENMDDLVKEISISNFQFTQSEIGYNGDYSFVIDADTKNFKTLSAKSTYTFPIYFGATLNTEKASSFNMTAAKKSRLDFLKICQEHLVLETPNDVLNKLFYFSKIRASESIYNSSMGLVHSPGGGNYYVGIWANDQVEYSGPFFPYLGYSNGNLAAYNAYNMFMKNMPTDDSHIAYAFEVDGNFPMTHLDRGDAAMIAYGTSQYLLASGNIDQAKHLWPLLEWSLEYCNLNKNEQGAVISESDEMEGRIETGTANLSTSSLYYGGLKNSIRISEALNMSDKAKLYSHRMVQMEKVIEDYFGASIEGLSTYKYFDENKFLRHWICLPLVMGITKRKDATLSALFDKLWTENGILVEYIPEIEIDKTTFWDRATLYALKGALKVGEVELAQIKLLEYSTKRLLGNHVPYPIEAFPENDMKHLSAESALYCRVFIEGLLGIEPLGFSEIRITPKLPRGWSHLSLKQIFLCGIPVDIFITREEDGLQLLVQTSESVLFKGLIENEASIDIKIYDK